VKLLTPKVRTWVLGTAVACVLFVGTLGLLFRLLPAPSAPARDGRDLQRKTDYVQRGEFVSSIGRFRNQKIHSRLTHKGEVLIDTIYDIDENLLRSPPRRPQKVSRRHLILTGCSFTFGEGVPLEKTFAALLEERLSSTNVYNISFQGGGLHLSLRYLDQRPLRRLAPEDEGEMIYLFIPDHLRRWQGSPEYLVWAPSSDPHYRLIDGRTVFQGPLRKQPFYLVYQLAARLGLFPLYQKLGVNARPDLEVVDEFAIGLRELREKYLATHPKGSFKVLLYPEGNNPILPALKRRLEQFQIPVLDPDPELHQAVRETGGDYAAYSIPHDGHPSARMHEFLSGWIYARLHPKSRTAD
jgi:hypothetical protein